MRYGVLYNKTNVNIGDDIQAYATARFLPSVDYFIDREHIDDFITEDKKAVSVIMNAWYMWAKWNWPPSKYINPHFVGFHYADHQLAKQPGSPVKYEFLQGKGGEYLKAYGPVGCRDKFTLKNLKKLGIDSYFSGCITLTLPRQPETSDKGTYICIVDMEAKVTEKIKKQLEGSGVEVRVLSHTRECEPNLSWEERLKIVKKRLTVYQNARCVITKKLHCALPCLAMEVPVFLIKGMENDIRFDPYYDFLHRTTTKKFMADNYKYDFLNPPANKNDYRIVRERLIKSCMEFVEKTKTMNDDPDKLDKTKAFYTQQELLQWRHDTMKKSMDEWLAVNRKSLKNLDYMDCIVKENQKLRKQLDILGDHEYLEIQKPMYKIGKRIRRMIRQVKRIFG